MLSKKYILGLLLLPVFFCAGCWDVEEVNRRASPNAMFFDVGQKDDVQVGIDMHVPGTLQPPVNNMEQQFEKNHGVISAEGKSPVEAWSRLQTLTSRNIFFGQLRSIVISDDFARRDIVDSMNFIGRIPFVSNNIHLLVTKEEPEKLLDITNRSNFVPGNYIEQYFQSPYKEMLAKPITLFEVFARTDNRTADPYIPMISTEQKNYRISGTAIFSGNRMVGELSQPETQAFSLLTGASTGLLTVPAGEDKMISFLLTNSDIEIEPKHRDGDAPVFDVNVGIQGMTVETDPYQGELTVEAKKEYDRAAGNFARGKIEALLVKLQQLNSDPVGFGEKFRSKYPDQWEEMDWHQVFPQAQFKVDVKFNTKKTGLFR